MTQKRALIVDDDYANRSLWELVLTGRGYEVLMAEDVKTGKSQVNEDVSLYLVDYHLPDAHGTEVVSLARGLYPASLIVMVSMDDDADVIREAMRAGGNLFMVKPASLLVMDQILNEIDAGDLTANVRQLINRNGRRTYA